MIKFFSYIRKLFTKETNKVTPIYKNNKLSGYIYNGGLEYEN